jgi:enolase-phosphatase E1
VAECFSLAAEHISIVLLDIEGTTTPIAFVHDVLFPYARARVRAYLEEAASDPEILQIVEDLRAELPASGFQLPARALPASSSQPPARSLESKGENRMPEAGSGKLEADIVSYVYWLMDRDRKSGPLKALQGRIWEQGYRDGELKGEVYPDVPDAFARWTADGVRIGIFSSGSVLAQQLLFANSTAGDLSGFLSNYFDTGVGAKGEADSYRRIVAALGVAAARVLFVSDVAKELDAAREAGLRTLLCVRPPASAPASNTHGLVESFDTIT